jgi:hypothetical protein
VAKLGAPRLAGVSAVNPSSDPFLASTATATTGSSLPTRASDPPSSPGQSSLTPRARDAWFEEKACRSFCLCGDDDMKLACTALALAFTASPIFAQNTAQNVKITPIGSHPGELCANDRAMVFEDPTGVRLLYDPAHNLTAGDDPRLGGVHRNRPESRSPVTTNAERTSVRTFSAVFAVFRCMRPAGLRSVQRFPPPPLEEYATRGLPP